MNALAIALRARAVELMRGAGNASVSEENVTTNPTWRAQYRDMLADLRRRTIDPEKANIIDGMIVEIDRLAAEPLPEGRKIDVSGIAFQKLTLDDPLKPVGQLVPDNLRRGE